MAHVAPRRFSHHFPPQGAQKALGLVWQFPLHSGIGTLMGGLKLTADGVKLALCSPLLNATVWCDFFNLIFIFCCGDQKLKGILSFSLTVEISFFFLFQRNNTRFLAAGGGNNTGSPDRMINTADIFCSAPAATTNSSALSVFFDKLPSFFFFLPLNGSFADIPRGDSAPPAVKAWAVEGGSQRLWDALIWFRGSLSSFGVKRTQYLAMMCLHYKRNTYWDDLLKW